MARLNEPSVQTESVDALKRRFIRQNREIARANSTQSLRIRDLEAETSRLLAENIALREQLIKLESELDRQSSPRLLAENINSVKGKFEAKLNEFQTLIAELGRIQNSAERRNGSPKKSTKPKKMCSRSPEQRNWRRELSMNDVGGDEGRLPVIAEDKTYPRRTLDREEILGLLSNGLALADSPEIGPPPVAHFDVTDPVKYDPGYRPQDMDAVTDEVDNDSSNLMANLETRKRRRDSKMVATTQDPTVSNEPQKVSKPETSGTTLKGSAKRKFDMKENEDMAQTETPDALEFTFRKKETSAGDKASEQKVKLDTSTLSRKNQEKEVNVISASRRKALEPKSGNVSPKKSQRDVLVKPFDESKKTRIGDNKPKVDRNRSFIQPAPMKPSKVSGIAEENVAPITVELEPEPEQTEIPPETPFGEDLFSPLSTGPSATRQELRDTPPPSDLKPSASEDNSLSTCTGRMSRRARGTVNYALPNLRDKMRRPGKELGPAVGSGGEILYVRTSSMSSHDFQPSGESDQEKHREVRTVQIKKEKDLGAENGDDEAWKTLPTSDGPASPLLEKSVHFEPEQPVLINHRRRRVSSLYQPQLEDLDDASSLDQPSGSKTAISALVNAGRASKAKSRELQSRRDSVDLERAMEKLDLGIFDFTESSSPTNDSTQKEEPQKRVSRRNSVSGRLDGGKNVTSRRMTVGISRVDSGGSEAALPKENDELPALAQEVEPKDRTGPNRSRSEKAASRRRSMML